MDQKNRLGKTEPEIIEPENLHSPFGGPARSRLYQVGFLVFALASLSAPIESLFMINSGRSIGGVSQLSPIPIQFDGAAYRDIPKARITTYDHTKLNFSFGNGVSSKTGWTFIRVSPLVYLLTNPEMASLEIFRNSIKSEFCKNQVILRAAGFVENSSIASFELFLGPSSDLQEATISGACD